MNSDLTDRQSAILTEIENYHRATREICSISYLARRLTVQPNTVREHLEALHRKGWLSSPSPGLPRRPRPSR